MRTDDRVVEVLRRLISMNTVSDRSTIEITDYIAEYLENAGFSIDRMLYERAGVKKVNLIASKGEGSPILALSGHMDTVPFNATDWKNLDPLQLTERSGKWYGRGTCDMKGFLAIAMVAGSNISSLELCRAFALVFTSDEEVGCIGAKELVKERGAVADMCIIGEPTDLMPFILHKGYMYVRIELQGKRGHSSRPDEGLNVIERALPTVLKRINSFRDALRQIRDERLEPPYPTLNTGVVSTGENAAKNIIPNKCVIELDMRPVPGQDVEEIMHSFRRYVTDDEEFVNGVSIRIDYARMPTSPLEVDPNDEVVRAVSEEFGFEACSTSFNTEGGVFRSAGMRSVICGPGSIQQAHQPNEYLHGRYLTEETVQGYSNVIRNICKRR